MSEHEFDPTANRHAQTRLEAQEERVAEIKARNELERLRQADAEITATLKGPMRNLERALLVGDRKDIRAAIAKMSPL